MKTPLNRKTNDESDLPNAAFDHFLFGSHRRSDSFQYPRMSAPKNRLGRLALTGVALLLLVAAIIFVYYPSGPAKSELARREARDLSHLVFLIYLGDPEALFDASQEKVSNRHVLRAIISTNRLNSIERMIGPSRTVEWIEKELIIDHWGEPYAFQISEEGYYLRVTARSGGPDRRLGTSDDVEYTQSASSERRYVK